MTLGCLILIYACIRTISGFKKDTHPLKKSVLGTLCAIVALFSAFIMFTDFSVSGMVVSVLIILGLEIVRRKTDAKTMAMITILMFVFGMGSCMVSISSGEEKNEETTVEALEESTEAAENITESTVVETEESTKESVEESSEEVVEETTETEEVKKTTEENVYEPKRLQDIIGQEGRDLVFSVLREIGFTSISYVEQMGELNNFIFTGSGRRFVVTAYSDEVCRVFEPNGGPVYYEDGEIKKSMKNYKDVRLTFLDDGFHWHTMIAKEIVKPLVNYPSTLKFKGESNWIVQERDKMVTVAGTLQAKNAFGVKIEEDFTVQYIYTGEVEGYNFDFSTTYIRIGDNKEGTYIDLETME